MTEESTEYWLLKSATNTDQTVRELIENFRGHEGTDHTPLSPLEKVFVGGFLEIDKSQQTQLTEKGLERLNELRQR